jgi:hypothetical protein
MAIDTKSEKLYHMTEAAELFPGRPPSRNTLLRWRRQGLETILVGGQRYTSAEAVERFIQRTNQDAGADLHNGSRQEGGVETEGAQ